jgi:hypothetical protein
MTSALLRLSPVWVTCPRSSPRAPLRNCGLPHCRARASHSQTQHQVCVVMYVDMGDTRWLDLYAIVVQQLRSVLWRGCTTGGAARVLSQHDMQHVRRLASRAEQPTSLHGELHTNVQMSSRIG